MAEITKITSPMVPRENIGVKNRPTTEQTFELNHPNKVNKPNQEPKVTDRETGGQALRDNLGSRMIQSLLRDSNDQIYNVQKMLTLLQLGISTSDAVQDAHVKQLLNQIFASPEELLETLQQQDEASVLFKGQTFVVLRDILQRFDDNPKIRDALVQLLKTFEQNVNSENSVKTILYNCNNILDYMFTKDREQFASYLNGLAEMLLPEGNKQAAQLVDEDGNPLPLEEQLAQSQPAHQEEIQEQPQYPATGEQMPVDKEGNPIYGQAQGQPVRQEEQVAPEQQGQEGKAATISQREAASVLKNNLLPLLGEIVVKYHQNERIRDVVMVVVHNIVRVDKGTPESLQEAVDALVSELKKAANLPDDFGKNLMNSLVNGAGQAKNAQDDVMSKLAAVISETLHTTSSSPAALRQAENLLFSMLQNQNSMMNVLHFILPMQMQNDRIFAEMYVDPDSDEHNSGKDDRRTRKIFLTADSENHGTFEFCFWETGEHVDFSMRCPQILVKPLGGMRRMIGDLMQTHGYTMNSFHVEEFTESRSVAQVFPKLLHRKVGIDVRI